MEQCENVRAVKCKALKIRTICLSVHKIWNKNLDDYEKLQHILEYFKGSIAFKEEFGNQFQWTLFCHANTFRYCLNDHRRRFIFISYLSYLSKAMILWWKHHSDSQVKAINKCYAPLSDNDTWYLGSTSLIHEESIKTHCSWLNGKTDA